MFGVVNVGESLTVERVGPAGEEIEFAFGAALL